MKKSATSIEKVHMSLGNLPTEIQINSFHLPVKAFSKKLVTWLTLAAMAFVFGITAAAPASHAGSTANLNQCVDKAVYGKGKKLNHIKIEGHHFHCYPAKATRATGRPGVVRVVGRLDHDIKNFMGTRPDDEVYYGFDLKNGRVASRIEKKIIRGGFAKTLSKKLSNQFKKTPDWRAQLADKLAGKKIEKDTEDLIRGIGSRFTGKGWDKAANVIVSRIAREAAKRYK